MPGPVIAGPSWNVTLGDWAGTLAWSPSGEQLVAGSLAGDVVLLDAPAGEVSAKLADHPLGVLTAAWSPDGQRVAVGGQDGIVHLYEPDGRRAASVETDGWVAGLAWAPDSTMVAVASGRRLRLVGRDGEVAAACSSESSTITAVAWSPDGRRVGVTAYGGVTWYDPERLPDTSPARRFAWKGSLLSLALAPNGKWACAGAQDQSIHLWKLWSGDDLQMSGYPSKIEHLDFRHDSRWMASACLAELTVWDFGGKGPGGTGPATGAAHDRHVSALAWQPYGDLLLTGGADGGLVLWPSPRKTGQTLRPIGTDEQPAAVASLTWRPDGRAVAVGRDDGTVELRPLR